MDKLAWGDRMTVREAARALGCNPETVKGHIRELWPGLMQNGKTTLLDEKQVTVILEKMKRGFSYAHHVTGGDVAAYNSGIAGTETPKSRLLQMKILQEQMNALYEAEIAELRAENLRQKERLADAEPKAAALDAISAGKGDMTVRELASILALPRAGEKTLLYWLREDGYLVQGGIPARQFVDRGILYEKFIGKSAKPRLMVTPKGLTHFSMKYAAGRCKAESADDLLPCAGYRIGKHGGVWFHGITDGKRNKKMSYSRDQEVAPAVCRACVKIIGKTVPFFQPHDYIFLKSSGAEIRAPYSPQAILS
jgi:phage antirepressor YoqD-like protein